MKSRIMSALVDTLVNSMETFMDSNDFEEYLNNEYDIDSSVAKKMFADYWKISANDRFEWDYPEWSRWLKGYGIRESVMKIEKRKEIVEIKEEVRIPQGNQEIILEKGDKIRILKEFRLDRKASMLLLEKGLKAYMDFRFGGESGFYNPVIYTTFEVGEALAIELADALSDIASDVSDPQFENNYNWKDWTLEVLKGLMVTIRAGNYNI